MRSKINGGPTRSKTQGHGPGLLPAHDYSPKLERGGAIVALWSSDYPPLERTGMTSKRPLSHTRNRFLRMLVVMGILTIGAVGCGDGPTEPDFNPDFMVGD